MFERFNNSARSVVFRARDSALAESRDFIEPHHLLVALIDLYPELLDRILSEPPDIQAVQHELTLVPNLSHASSGLTKVRLCGRSKRVLVDAAEEARFCWQRWELPRRKAGQVLPEDLAYWEARFGQPIRIGSRPNWFERWMLRRSCEVDQRHLLLGLLKGAEWPGVTVLTKRGVTLEATRQRLCATGE